MTTTLLSNLSYVDDAHEADTPPRRLDLYVPEGEGPFPVALWIHGGGWHSGSKEVSFAGEYTDQGIALVSVDYRLTRDGIPFPAPIEDCVSALAWLGREASKFSLDLSRLGVFGHSAGGHLTALLALASAGATPFAIPDLPRISCAAIWAGALNLGREAGAWPHTFFPWNPADPYCRTFFPGGQYDEGFALWASPSSYVSREMPPSFIAHGDADTIVPWPQAQDFADKLKALGVAVDFELIPGAGHDLVSTTLHHKTRRFFQRIWQSSLARP